MSNISIHLLHKLLHSADEWHDVQHAAPYPAPDFISETVELLPATYIPV